MIVNLALTVLYFVLLVVTSPIRALSDATLPSGLSTALSDASSGLYTVGQVIPISTLLTVLAAMLAIEGTIFAYKIVRWAYRKIPGIS